MSLPSITDASESKKKLQCAWSRPRSASDRAPVWSRNSRNASQRWPTSCPRTLTVLFSPRNVWSGSSGYFPTQSITAKLRRRPALPKSRDASNCVEADAADFVGDRRLRTRTRRPEWRRRSRSPADRSCRGESGRTCAPLPRCRAGTASANRSPTAPPPPAVGPFALMSTGANSPVSSGRDAHDRLGERHLAELHLDRAVGKQRQLRVGRARGIESANAAPGHRVLGRRRRSRTRARRCWGRGRRGTARRAEVPSAASPRCGRCWRGLPPRR